MKYDIALIGTGGGIADSIVQKFSTSGLKIVGFGRTIPKTIRLFDRFVEFDLENPEILFERTAARTAFYNIGLKGRFAKETAEFKRQGEVTAPHFRTLLDSLNLDVDRLMTMGSSEEYGPRDTNAEIFEDSELKPISSYGSWKQQLFQNAQVWSKQTRKPSLHVRAFNVFGPGADPKMFIGDMVSTLVRGEVFKTTKGEQWRSFVSISLVALCLEKLITLNDWQNVSRAGAFNLSTVNYLQLKEVVRIAQELLPSAQVDMGAIPYRTEEVWHQNPDLNLIGTLMGKSAEEDFTAKLKETIDFFKMKSSQ